MMRRRLFLITAGAACSIGAPSAGSAPLRTAPRPRVGVERLLADSGLAGALRRDFAADSGLAFDIVPAASTSLLDTLERGELDLALTHAPALETRLEAAGLIHDRRPIASTDFVIVGPVDRGRDPAAIAGLRDGAAAFGRIAQSQANFLTLGDGSGTHLAEQAVWRAAAIAPRSPWYRQASPERPALAQAADAAAYALTDRASWLAAAPHVRARLRLLVEGDPALATVFHSARSFRSSHPAAKLLSGWLGGRGGRRVVARTAGFRTPPG